MKISRNGSRLSMSGLPGEERKDIVERIESRGGLHQLEYMKTLRMGNDKYDMIRI